MREERKRTERNCEEDGSFRRAIIKNWPKRREKHRASGIKEIKKPSRSFASRIQQSVERESGPLCVGGWGKEGRAIGH